MKDFPRAQSFMKLKDCPWNKWKEFCCRLESGGMWIWFLCCHFDSLLHSRGRWHAFFLFLCHFYFLFFFSCKLDYFLLVFFFSNSVVPFLGEGSARDSADNYLLLDLVSLELEIVTFLPSIFPFVLEVDFSLARVAFSRSRDSDAVILHSSMVGSILGSISCFLAWAPPASSVDLTVFLLLAFFPWERFPFCFCFVLLILVCCSPFRLWEGICWFCGWFHAKWIGLKSSLGVGSNFFNSCSFSRSLLILFLWLRS